MAFGNTPATTTQGALASNQIPLGEVYVPGHAGGNATALQGGPASTDGNGNESAPVATYTPDGNDLTQGVTTDAAVVGDNPGTHSAKLRGLSKIWNDIWDSVNHRIRVDGSGVTQPVSGTISFQHGNVVSTVNSSTALLGSNGVFTGTSESSLLYSAISVEVFADQASAAGGLVVQQSQNGTNWDTTDSFSISASTAFSTIVNLVGQFFRINYTNGATAQGAFRLQVIKQASESVLPRSLTALGNLKVAMQEGSITANAGTNLNTSLLALEAGGHLAAIDTAQGAQADTTATSDGGTFSLLALFKRLLAKFPTIGPQLKAASLSVTLATDNPNVPISSPDGSQVTIGTTTDASSATTLVGLLKAIKAAVQGTLSVSGTFWQATQPVSGTVTETNSAASKADLDTIVTNTNAFKDTSATGTVTLANDAVSIALPGGQATVLVQILMGTLVGTLNFEVSPDSGTTWYAISGKAVNASSFASTATAAGAWQFNVSGLTNFRVRLGPVTSGTSGTITIRLSQGVSNLAINNASALGQAVMASSAPVVIASDQSAVKVKSDFVEITGNGPGVVNAANTDLFGWTDVSGYKSFSVQTTGTWVGTLTIQGSNDGATAVALYGMTPVSGGMTQVLSSNSIFTAPVTTHYIRVRMTTFTSNASLVGLLDLFTFPAAFVSMLASQQGTWTMQPGNTQNTTPWLTQNAPSTSGGTSDYHLISAASTNANSIKGSAGQVYGYEIGNNSATVDAYVKLYNKATAPTVGTDTPFRTIYVPKGSRASFHSTTGLALGTGIGIAITGAMADSDATAVAASAVSVDIDWK